ncbi:S1C family serine protease [Deinococcus lacus]|uniref:S1C family serine protease n=1 Tax=Deinococcus lacus TaxID=392561 RepID=A0ABW1YAG6_9DEIO
MKALSFSLLLGTLLLTGCREQAGVASVPVTTQASTVAAVAQASPAPVPDAAGGIAAATPLDEQRARTESEANTVDVVKRSQDGLVFIDTTIAAKQNDAQRQALERFGFSVPPQEPGEGMGSGFFVTPSGDILTNYHVVEDASEISVRVHGQTQAFPAKVVSTAPDFDLALIRAEGLPPSAIRPLPLGDMSQLDVGLKAIALGAPFGLDFSVSEGIISSLERTAPVGVREVEQSVIQTDAAINPGNSGGPLLNSAGQVIGVNTQILTGGVGQSAGVGFAIPVSTVQSLLPKLQQGGEVKTPSLGISLVDLSRISPEQRRGLGFPETGLMVGQVFDASPAQAAGLSAGTPLVSADGQSLPPRDADIITAVDGQMLEDREDLRRALLARSFGDTIRLTVQRAGKTREVTAVLEEFEFPR